MRGEPNIDFKFFCYNFVIFRMLIDKGEHYLLCLHSLRRTAQTLTSTWGRCVLVCMAMAGALWELCALQCICSGNRRGQEIDWEICVLKVDDKSVLKG